MLAQAVPGGTAELEARAAGLTACINFTLAETCSPNPPVVRAIRKIHQNGEIVLQFNNPDHARKAQEQSSEWPPLLNPNLKLKVKLYTVMVHGIPTSFDVSRADEFSKLKQENQGLLDSLQSIRWVNTHSLLISKPFSSIFISLSDPEDANAAIFNKVNFEGELKPTERSKKHAGASQCFKCQAYGHHQNNCPSEPCCAHCAYLHKTKDCPRGAKATQRCINCTKAYIFDKRKTNPDFSTSNISPEESIPMAHSAQASHCPIHRTRTAPSRSKDYFLVTKSNAKSHAVR